MSLERFHEEVTMEERREQVRYRTIKARFQTLVPSDPSNAYKYTPASTLGIDVECIVAYTCKKGPEIQQPPEITGLNQVGFVFSSEYKVRVNLESVKKYECTIAECEQAIQYKFKIKYYIYLVCGLGFGLGSSTFAFGTLGFTTDSISEFKEFETECFCCDE